MAGRIEIRTTRRTQLIDITTRVYEFVREAGLVEGLIHLHSLHTTCALTLNEGHDPDVAADMVGFMGSLVPDDAGFDHAEGNSDAHIKTSLFGPGLTLPVEDGVPLLGTWQRIFLAEWDGPRDRRVAVTVVRGK